jgi:hypothetical protein
MARTSHGLATCWHCRDGSLLPNASLSYQITSLLHNLPSQMICMNARCTAAWAEQASPWQQRIDGRPGWQKLWKAIAPPGAARHTSAGKMAMRLRARRVRCGCARWTYSTSSATSPSARLLLLLAALPLLLLLLAVLMLLRAMVTAALLKHASEHDPPDRQGKR